MAKRKIPRKSKRRLAVFGTISVAAIVCFCFSLLYNLYTIYDLLNEKKELENLYVELQGEAETLKKDIEKLNDEEYLAGYAREHFLYVGDGEYKLIIDPDSVKEEVDEVSNELNKNYIISGFSIFMILVFIYVFSKGDKNKVKNN